MTLEIIEPELEQAVATLLAESVIERLFIEIEKLSKAPIDDEWFKTVLDVISFCGNIKIGFSHGQAMLLAIIKPRWEEVPFPIRKQYNLDFMHFAQAVTGSEVSTINNNINTANIWLINKTKPNHPVKVVERDVNKRPILNAEGKPFTQEVEFNPFLIDMSKLLAVNARAAKGEMTDKLWEMLVDPVYTCSDVQKEHASTKINGELPDAYFSIVGPGLFFTKNGETVCIADELNWSEEDTIVAGIDTLIRNLHIQSDEKYINAHNRKGITVSAYEDTG